MHFQSNIKTSVPTDINTLKSNKTEPDTDWNQGSENLQNTRLHFPVKRFVISEE